jgi:UDP-N-acetyl-D-mannosaminuronate dehydrogenase
LFQRNFKFWITSLVIFDLLLMPNSTEMNRLDDLRKNRTSVAVLGINQNGLEIALSIAKNFPVIISDTNINPEVKVQDFLLSRGLSVDSKITEKGNISLSESKTDLSSAGVFYLNGLSTSLVDWTEIKATTGRAAASLSAGDWVIFGEDIDPDLAEVILVDILESKSGLTKDTGS